MKGVRWWGRHERAWHLSLSARLHYNTTQFSHIWFQSLLTTHYHRIKYLIAWFKVIFMFVHILFLLFRLSLDKTHCELSAFNFLLKAWLVQRNNANKLNVSSMSCLPLLSPGYCNELANCKKIIWVISSPDDIFQANEPYEKPVPVPLRSKYKLASRHLCEYHIT